MKLAIFAFMTNNILDSPASVVIAFLAVLIACLLPIMSADARRWPEVVSSTYYTATVKLSKLKDYLIVGISGKYRPVRSSKRCGLGKIIAQKPNSVIHLTNSNIKLFYVYNASNKQTKIPAKNHQIVVN